MKEIAKGLFGAGLALWASRVEGGAAAVAIPNASFETPVTEFAGPFLTAWEKTPKPDWYVEDPGAPERAWVNLTGNFKNTPVGDASHIDNIDGNQALFLTSLPTAGIFQDYNSTDLLNPVPTHAFDAKFEVGKSYELTAGVIGGGGGMPAGATLMMVLYYRDAQNNQVPVASTTITHTPETFPSLTHFVDQKVEAPAVKAGDAWAGKNIGILIVSTVAQDKIGGYWDVDHLRLTSTLVAPVVPNHSFETPVTEFAGPFLTAWEKTPKPDWYVEDPGAPERAWVNLTGNFKNTPVGDASHIDNIDGNQALFLTSLPTAGIFQDYNSTDLLNPVPTHAFDAKFEVGRSLKLTVGVIGGGGGMPTGASMMLALYYRNADGNQVPVASTQVVHSPETFPSLTHLVDVSVETPVVTAGDAWAGQQVGILIVSTVAQDKIGGYWDLDDVRLTYADAPSGGFALTYTREGNDLQMAWPSTAGQRYQVKVSTDLRTWNDLEAPLAGTGGELSKRVPLAANPQAFFAVVALPGS